MRLILIFVMGFGTGVWMVAVGQAAMSDTARMAAIIVVAIPVGVWLGKQIIEDARA